MFKSSFAREILEETRHNAGAASSLEAAILMPAMRHPSRYRSSFAASTHSMLDNLEEDSGGSGHEEEEAVLSARFTSGLRAFGGSNAQSTSRQVRIKKGFIFH